MQSNLKIFKLDFTKRKQDKKIPDEQGFFY